MKREIFTKTNCLNVHVHSNLHCTKEMLHDPSVVVTILGRRLQVNRTTMYYYK